MSTRKITRPPSAFDLAHRPGFLIRRLHQIHTALFIEECADFNVTPVQYSVLTAIAEQSAMEQARLAQEVGVDRATLANVVARLEVRG
ncbi:MAG: MarR family transcriptional regulator, partial [Pseudorhodoplanes sp.]